MTSDVLLSLIILVTTVAFFLRYDVSDKSLLGTRMTGRFVFLTALLTILNFGREYQIETNDSVRMVLYMMYFQWGTGLYRSVLSRSSALRMQMTFVFGLLLILVPFEFLFYDVFHVLIDSDFVVNREGRRITTTLRDPNSFSFLVVICAYILTNKSLSIKRILLILSLTALFVLLSGSRLGLMLLSLLFVSRLSLVYRKKGIITSGFIIVVLMVFSSVLLKTPNSKDLPLVERLTATKARKGASASSAARWRSIQDGLEFSNISNLILPPGNLFFKDKWRSSDLGRHYPHSTFIYLLGEYGLFIFWPLFTFRNAFAIANKYNNLVLLTILFFGLLLLPNVIYYSTIQLGLYALNTQKNYG